MTNWKQKLTTIFLSASLGLLTLSQLTGCDDGSSSNADGGTGGIPDGQPPVVVLPPGCGDEELPELELPPGVTSCAEMTVNGAPVTAVEGTLKWIVSDFDILTDNLDHPTMIQTTYGKDLDGETSIRRNVASVPFQDAPDNRNLDCKPGSTRQDYFSVLESYEEQGDVPRIDNMLINIAGTIGEGFAGSLRDADGNLPPGLGNSLTSFVRYNVHYDFDLLLIIELQEYVDANNNKVCGQLKGYFANKADNPGIQTEMKLVQETHTGGLVDRQVIEPGQTFNVREEQIFLNQPANIRACEGEADEENFSEARADADNFPINITVPGDNGGDDFKVALAIEKVSLQFQYNENEIKFGQISGAAPVLGLLESLSEASETNELIATALESAVNVMFTHTDINLGGPVTSPAIQAPAGADLPETLMNNAEPLNPTTPYVPNCQVFFSTRWYPVMLLTPEYCTNDYPAEFEQEEGFDQNLGTALYQNLIINNHSLFDESDLFTQATNPCGGISTGIGLEALRVGEVVTLE